MGNVQTFNRSLAIGGNSLLLIWWGLVLLIGPLTIGIGAIGTGLILLVMNSLRRLKGIAARGSTTTLGVIALAWGILDLVYEPRLEASFAMLLIIIGLVSLSAVWTRSRAEA